MLCAVASSPMTMTVSASAPAAAHIQVDCDINVDDVAVVQGSAVGDAVAYAVIDGGADALGEGTISQGRGVSVVFYAHLVHCTVYLIRSDARLQSKARCQVRFSADYQSSRHRGNYTSAHLNKCACMIQNLRC